MGVWWGNTQQAAFNHLNSKKRQPQPAEHVNKCVCVCFCGAADVDIERTKPRLFLNLFLITNSTENFAFFSIFACETNKPFAIVAVDVDNC